MKKLSLQNKSYKIYITYFFLIMYGCFLGYLIIKTTSISHPIKALEEHYMSLRVTWLDYFISDLSKTGVYSGFHRLYDHNASMYFYLSHFAVFAKLNTAYTFFYTQLIVVLGCVALYPSIFYRLTGNIYVSLLSIFFFKLYNPFSLYFLSDSYWIYGWTTFISLPILFFLFRDKWQKSNWIWILGLIGVISVSNVFRANAGLSVIISLILLMFVKIIYPAIKSKKLKPVIIGACVCLLIIFSNGFFTSTVPHIYQSATSQPECLPMKGPWHSLYIGLGWERGNPFGLEYADAYGYMNREYLLYDTEEGYYIGAESPAYIDEVKKVYFDNVFSNLGYCIGSYIKKSFIAIINSIRFSLITPPILYKLYYQANSMSYIVTIFLSMLMIFYLKNIKADEKKLFLKRLYIFSPIILIFILCGILPALIATPFIPQYLFGAVSTFDCMVLTAYIIALTQITKYIKLKLQK